MSLLACYGTLVIITLLGTVGVSIAIDETLWAGTIVAFAFIATCGLAFGIFRHKQPWPILMGGSGSAIIGYAMYVQYNRLTEITGFLLLCAAVLWDRHIFHPLNKKHKALK
jgi:lipoprotein signal peptidase